VPVCGPDVRNKGDLHDTVTSAHDRRHEDSWKASGTQALYLDAVRSLAAHYRRSPDELGEEEVRAYLLSLRERGVALGTFKTNHGGIRFLYRWTLDRDWPLLGGKKDPSAKAAAPAVGSAGFRDPRASGLCEKPRSQDLLSVMYACGLRISEAATPGSRSDRQHPICCCVSLARATSSDLCRCHGLFSAICVTSGEPTATRAGNFSIETAPTSQHARSGLYLPKCAHRR
jgi:hypothetical protein